MKKQILIDFSLAKNLKESEHYNIILSEEEMSILTSLDHFDNIKAYYTLSGSDDYFNGYCQVSGVCYLKDSRDISHLIEYPFSNDVDFVISLSDEENSDILPEEDGSYDIRPVILALIYDSIPSYYTETDLNSLDDDGTSYFTESEFDKRSVKEEK